MKKEKSNISVVIPAYNEESRITVTLRRIFEYCRVHFVKFEIIVVDDGSRDNTSEVVKSFIKRRQTGAVRLVSLKKNKGKGCAVRTGLMKARYEYVLMTDADGCTPIQDIQRLLRHINKASVIYGSRYLDKSLLKIKQPLMRRVIGRAGNLVIRVFLGINMVDTQCGFKLFTRRAARIICPLTKVDRWGWDLEALVVARENNIKTIEVPVTWKHVEGSTFRAGSGLRQTLKEVFEIRKRLQKGSYKA